MRKQGVLLINLGTPLSPKPSDVLKYLSEFLTDENIIDLPFLARQLLVRGVIVPKRYRLSAKSYQKIWTEEGSPLLVYAYKVKHLLQETLGKDFIVEMGMRYQSPSIEEGLKKLQKSSIETLTIIPLFPQYASATTGSICKLVFQSLAKWSFIPTTKVLTEFYQHPTFIEAFCSIAKTYPLKDYDHILMSFHGLPEKALKKDDPHGMCLASASCCHSLHLKNYHCYGAQCYATAKAIASTLNLSPDQYTICFQSRLGKSPWISPFTSDLIRSLPKQGYRNVLVMCPAFVADCLETLYEIGMEYHEDFLKHGGKTLTLMEGLNAHPMWIHSLKELILSSSTVAI